MNSHRLALCVLLISLLPVGAYGQHRPLLPRPQELKYGSGRLALKGLGIRFGSSPASEDRFAATDLARALVERTGDQPPIWESPGVEKAIVLTRTGAVDPLPVPDEQPGPESREAYTLKVTPQGVEIQGRSSAAVFYGVQTLRQLVEGEGDRATLPEVEIHDWSSLAYRGLMVDMSQGMLPTEEEVKRQLDFLARWKANQYYFYNEASIELEGFPLLLNPVGRFRKEQVRSIIAYGRDRHIDVIPCLELYSHLHDLFRIEKYSDLADFPHAWEFNPSNAKVKVLLSDWVEQFVQLFPSPFVHIGFDEAFQIEYAAKQQGAEATPAKLFIEQLNNVAGLFQQRGKCVMAWGDIIVKFPDIVPELPRGLIAVAWYYEATPDPEYKGWLVPMIAKGIPHFVASGVHSFDEIAPDYDTTFENIDTFLAAGRKSKALGLMNTVWESHVSYRNSWPGIAYGAAAPWQSTPMDQAAFFSEYAQLMYPAAVAPEVASGLQNLNKAEVALQKVLGQATMDEMWKDPFALNHLKQAQAHREDLRQARLLAEDAAEHLDRALSLGGDPTILSSLLLASRLVDYAGMKYLYAVEIVDLWGHAAGTRLSGEQLWKSLTSGIYFEDHSRTADLMDLSTQLKEAYRSNWLAEFTTYRLGMALGRWDAEYLYWHELQSRLQAFADSFKEGEPLPPLNSIVHPR